MQATFTSIEEPAPGPRWQELFASSWDAYQHWFLKEGEARRPGFLTCRSALREHLPELILTWERLVDLAGGGDLEARFLSLYRPTPYLSGCSQAVWTRDSGPLLVRNYDYHPRFFEGTILKSKWNGVQTIVQSDCLWGALDGMNEHGLTVSLAFGGRPEVGDGFGIPLVLRYILETCETCKQAKEVLVRVPSHMSYNVSVLDATGDWCTAHVAPDRPTQFEASPVTTNHQKGPHWTQYAQAVSSQTRWDLLSQHISCPKEDRARFVRRFLEPPVFSDEYKACFGTLYTAVYDPIHRTVEYRWKHRRWRQSFDAFEEGAMQLNYRSAKAS